MEKYQKKLHSMFNVNTEIILYEAYTETWARVLNIMITLYMENQKIKFSSYKKLCVKQFQKETVHGMVQSCKILRFMGLNYPILTTSDKSLRKSSILLYKEDTNVLCYYIITSLLFFYLDDFFEWCCNENIECIKMPKKIQNVEKFIHFIEEHYKEEEYSDLMEECLTMNYELKDPSLRMTSFFVDMAK